MRAHRLVPLLASLAAMALFFTGPCIRHTNTAESRKQQSKAEPNASVDVPVAKTRPKLDGKLDDPCWKAAVELQLLHGASKGATCVRICRDADNLYVAIVSRLNGPIPVPAKGEEGEHVALLVNSNGDHNSHYRVAIYASGSIHTSYHEEIPPWQELAWRPKLEVKGSSTEKERFTELVLPFSLFNMNRSLGPTIGFNVRRYDAVNKEHHCWRPTFSARDAGQLNGIPAREFPSSIPEQKAPLLLGTGSSHAGTTGEVKLELEGFLLGGDPHARGVIWDLAVNEKTGELFVLAVPRVRNCPEVQV